MKAIVCRGFDRDLGVEDVASPVLQEGQVRLRVRAAGVNFADGLLLQGRYQFKVEPPFVPGFEVCGDIVEGEGLGQTVVAMPDHGGWAEEVVVPATSVVPLPEGLDPLVAGGFPVTFGTAHFGLVERACLRPGEWILVHGAAGGAGAAAVACAKALGATVIATANGEERLDVARQAGADHLIDAASDTLRDQVKALTGGRGVDVVYDPVGGALFDASMRCTAPDGRILVVGFASGTVPAPPANLLLVKNLTVIGYDWGAYRRRTPERVRASLAEVLSWWHQGRLTPPPCVSWPLADAQQALQTLKARTVKGKIVLIP